MPGAAIAPQVVLATATLGGVLITAVAGEYRARRQDSQRLAERREDQQHEDRFRLHDRRVEAAADFMADFDRSFAAIVRVRAMVTVHGPGRVDSETRLLHLERLENTRASLERCGLLFPEATYKLLEHLLDRFDGLVDVPENEYVIARDELLRAKALAREAVQVQLG